MNNSPVLHALTHNFSIIFSHSRVMVFLEVFVKKKGFSILNTKCSHVADDTNTVRSNKLKHEKTRLSL